VPNRGYRFVATIERAQRHEADGSLDAQLAPFIAFSDADAAFKKALTVVPGHMCAAAALGIDTRSAARPKDPHTIDLAVAKAIDLARAGRHPDAARICTEALKIAPPGVAGWLLPAESMLNPTARPEIWADTFVILRDRAI